MAEQFKEVVENPDGTLSGQRLSAYPKNAPFWYRFTASPDLLHIQLAMDVKPGSARTFWRMQDGMYGLAYEHYDWSGIRDSSKGAIAEMHAYAKRILPVKKFREMLGLS